MSGAELIHLPNTLAKRIGPRVRVFTASVLRRAEIALAKISEQFEDWLRIDLDALEHAKNDIVRMGMSEPRLRELDRCARLLRGAGATFGYPIVSEFAGHLHEAITSRGESLPSAVIAAYVDAMKAAVREQVREPEDATATAIVSELEGQLKAGG